MEIGKLNEDDEDCSQSESHLVDNTDGSLTYISGDGSTITTKFTKDSINGDGLRKIDNKYTQIQDLDLLVSIA